VEKIHIPMKTLPESLEGLTIVQLTDIHAGPFMTAEEIRRVRETANRLDADLIVLTGDLIAGVKRDIPLLVEGLRGLQARYGVYACLGNHEAFGRLENAVTRELLGAGIRVLRNEGTAIEIGNARIELFGIDDLKSGRHGLGQSLTGSSGGDLRVLLSHRPEILTRASQEKIHLVLSGHYHGGQIRFGIGRANLSVAKFMTPYDEGLYRMGETVLFVGRGIGTTGLPIRINCSPQIAVLKISSRPARTDSGLDRA
jgi:predicted MPP superfamily phosphohydrolase